MSKRTKLQSAMIWVSDHPMTFMAICVMVLILPGIVRLALKA